MRRQLFKAIIVVIVTLSITTNASADIKLKLKRTEDKSASDEILYFKGARQRHEFSGINRHGKPYSGVWILQCDQKQLIGLNNLKKIYFSDSLRGGLLSGAEFAFNETQLPYRPSAPDPHSGGMVIEITTVTDTGERREMFGFTARHIKTTIAFEATPACKQAKIRQELDGWYVDLLYGVDCSPDLSGFSNEPFLAPYSKCTAHYNRHHYQFQRQQVGTAHMGFPLIQTRKVYDDEGRPIISTQEVVEVSTDELDSTLFDVPAGYTQIETRNYKPSLLERARSLFRKE